MQIIWIGPKDFEDCSLGPQFSKVIFFIQTLAL